MSAPAIYTATLTTGSLKLRESRIVAGLLLDGVSGVAWKEAVARQNVLQSRASGSAAVLARLLRARLERFDRPLWMMVRDGSKELATQALLACAIKHSALLRDFLDLVLRSEYRLFRLHLSTGVWSAYLDGCRSRDPSMPEWSESTRHRLRSTVFQILAQVGYLEDTRTREIKPVRILPELVAYLRARDENHLLRCLQLP